MKIASPKIPYEYQQVEYIEAPAAGYIDTLYIPDYANGFRITIDLGINTLNKRYGLLSNYNQGTSQLSLELTVGNKPRLWLNDGNVDTNNTNVINIDLLPSLTVGRNTVMFGYENKVCYIGCNGVELSGNYTTTISPATTTMYLFLDRAKRSGTFTESLKIYSCVIETKGRKVMDLIPCVRKIDNIFGMFDIATQRFLPVAGTGTFNKGSNKTVIQNGAFLENATLPSYYRPVEYIASSGTQYINLNYICKVNNLNITLDMAWTGATASAFETFAGFMQSTSQVTPRIGLHKYTSSLMFGANATTSSGRALTQDERFVYTGDFTSGAQKLYKNGAQIASNATTYNFSTNTCPLYLFARYCPDSMNYATMRLYSCTIKEGATIIRDLIPCYNQITMEIGLYDLITKTFYKNAGTGTFLKGNDIIRTDIESIITLSPALPEITLLPKIYRRLSYIGSSGSAYLNTGLPIHMNWKYEIIFQQNTVGTFRTWGAFNQSSYVGPNCSLTYISNPAIFAIRWESRSGQQTYVQCPTIDTNKHILIINNGVVTFDGVNKGSSTGHNSNFVTSYNAYLFTINPGGTTPTTNFNGKIYSYKVWDNNGILQQWFIPCENKITGEAGMYDIIQQEFHNSISTGVFQKGEVI